MPSTFLLVALLLACFTIGVLAEKVLDALKGSTVVLRPDVIEESIISVTWKHGEDLAAEWLGENVTFYRGFNGRCSLNTETGELTINDTRVEDTGVYASEINSKTLAEIRLQVFSPVPKPSITVNCNPEETKCTLTCSFDRTEDLGNIEISWIVDDSRKKEGRKLHITKGTSEETFICSLNNTVSSENSIKLKNPLFVEDATAVASIFMVLFGFFFMGSSLFFIFRFWFPQYKRHSKFRRILKEINETKLDEDELTLWDVDQMIETFFKGGNTIILFEGCELMLLTVLCMIWRILEENKDLKENLQNVQEIITMFFKETKEARETNRREEFLLWILRLLRGTNTLNRIQECERALVKVHQMISKFIKKRKGKRAEEAGQLTPLNEKIKLTLVKT